MNQFLSKLNSRKLMALVMFVLIEILDPELGKQTGGLFVAYIIGQSAVDAATNFKQLTVDNQYCKIHMSYRATVLNTKNARLPYQAGALCIQPVTKADMLDCEFNRQGGEIYQHDLSVEHIIRFKQSASAAQGKRAGVDVNTRQPIRQPVPTHTDAANGSRQEHSNRQKQTLSICGHGMTQ